MRAVFEQSWAMLQPRERAAMRRLAPFRGGFTLDAAREAASIELPVLLALTNKSFLRRSGDGRFSRHPLVWQYARERAKEHPDELRRAGTGTPRTSSGSSPSATRAFQHADGERMMLEIDADLENVTVAWRWACEREQRALLRSAVSSLGRYCWAWGRYDLQDELLPPALEIAADDPVLMGLLLVQQGSARTWRAIGDFGASLFDEALPLLEASAGPAEVAWALRGHAMVHVRLGRRDEAAASYARAASLYRQVGDVEGALMMAISRPRLADTVGEALARYDGCVGEARAAGPRTRWGWRSRIARGSCSCGASSRRRRRRCGRSRGNSRGMRAPFWSLDRRNLRALVCIERGRLRSHARCAAGRWPVVAGPLPRSRPWVTPPRWRWRRSRASRTSSRITSPRATWARRSLEHHRRRHGPAASYDLALHARARRRSGRATSRAPAAGPWSSDAGPTRGGTADRSPRRRWRRADGLPRRGRAGGGDVAAATAAVRRR
jgi:tetratricopeptide (TPR) repeat protein